MPHANLRRRSARVRPYLPPVPPPAPPVSPVGPAGDPGLHARVLDGLRALPYHRPPRSPRLRERERTPLVRLIDAQKTPTAEIPVVSEGVTGS